ncbi:PaaI family thioesterase [Corynebacterium flavescens]|uniref:PaaI family thioesterase n=1 Tax=Corynebacterium flavescens TaxID=28028 RepID=UPI003F918235
MEHLTAMQKLIATAGQRPLKAEELELFNGNNMGLGALLGIRLTHIAAGEVRSELEVTPEHHQPWGVANGGLYCSIAESTASIASIVAAQAPAVGVNNSTDFIKPVSAGIIEAVATPIQIGQTTHLWNVEMRQDGELVARTTLRTMIRG